MRAFAFKLTPNDHDHGGGNKVIDENERHVVGRVVGGSPTEGCLFACLWLDDKSSCRAGARRINNSIATGAVARASTTAGRVMEPESTVRGSALAVDWRR